METGASTDVVHFCRLIATTDVKQLQAIGAHGHVGGHWKSWLPSGLRKSSPWTSPATCQPLLLLLECLSKPFSKNATAPHLSASFWSCRNKLQRGPTAPIITVATDCKHSVLVLSVQTDSPAQAHSDPFEYVKPFFFLFSGT